MTPLDFIDSMLVSYYPYLITAFILVIILLILLVLVKSLAKALMLDLVCDAALSFADEFVGIGVGCIDVGDWIGAIFTYFSARKYLGNKAALFCALECANFIIFCFPPIDWALNLIPTNLIMTFFFSKYGKFKDKSEEVDKTILVAENANINVERFRKEKKKAKSLSRKGAPVEGIENAENTEENVEEELLQEFLRRQEGAFGLFDELSIDFRSEFKITENDIFSFTMEMKEKMPKDMRDELSELLMLLNDAKNTMKIALRFFENEDLPGADRYDSALTYINKTLESLGRAKRLKQDFDEFFSAIGR